MRVADSWWSRDAAPRRVLIAVALVLIVFVAVGALTIPYAVAGVPARRRVRGAATGRVLRTRSHRPLVCRLRDAGDAQRHRTRLRARPDPRQRPRFDAAAARRGDARRLRRQCEP